MSEYKMSHDSGSPTQLKNKAVCGMCHARCGVSDAALLSMHIFQRDTIVPTHRCAGSPFILAGQFGISMVRAATNTIDAASMWNSARREQTTTMPHDTFNFTIATEYRMGEFCSGAQWRVYVWAGGGGGWGGRIVN